MADNPIYWTNPWLLTSDCPVLNAEPVPGDPGSGNRWRLTLEGSPFYPGGGGQPADRGTVDGYAVLSLAKSDSGTIHEISAPGTWSPGTAARCEVDSRFRRDSMQQHSGQHLVSAALAAEGLATVSVHLGGDYCGIEVDAAEVPEEAIGRVLEYCDARIAENRKIVSHVLDPQQASDMNLRRALSSRADEAADGGRSVRVVEIDGQDAVGCAGVHLGDTGGIMGIVYIGQEKMRGRIRLKWIIGDRVTALARKSSDILAGVGQILSATPEEVPERVAALAEKEREVSAALDAAEYELGALLCRSAAGHGNAAALVVGGASRRIQGALEAAAGSALEAALFLGEAVPGGSRPWGIFLPESRAGLFPALKETVLTPAGGRGGGRAPFWRGTVSGDPDALTAAFLGIVSGTSD